MNKRALLFIIFLSALIAFYAGYSLQEDPLLEDVGTTAADATYDIDGSKVILRKGSADISTGPDASLRAHVSLVGEQISGSLDGHAGSDMGVIMRKESGDAAFYYGAAVLSGSGGTNALFLGDRVGQPTISIKDDMVEYSFMARRFDDVMSDAPTLDVSIFASIVDGTLVRDEQSISAQVHSFDECVAVGYPVMESYPEQCTTVDGRTFTRDISDASTADMIWVRNIAAGSVIRSPLTIRGEARGVWFFEGDFPVLLTDWDGRIIAEHYATAQGDWMSEGFVPFEAVLTFDVPSYGDAGMLILQKDNPSGLPEHDDALEIPIRFSSDDSVSCNLDFSNYPVNDTYQGEPVAVDFSTQPEARMFTTKIKEAAQSGPNIAGEYALATWGCGTSCWDAAIVSARTGEIVEFGIPAQFGYAFEVASELLIVNPEEQTRGLPIGSLFANADRVFYRVTANGLEELCREKIVKG